MPRIFVVVLFIFLLLFALLFPSNCAKAIFIQDIESLETTIEIQKDGSAKVTDILTYSAFNTSTSRQWLVRSTSLSEISVSQGERALAQREFATRAEEGKTFISWTSPGGEERWIIKYRQKGLVSASKDSDKFFRISFDGDQNAFIRTVKETIKLPAGAEAKNFSQRIFAAHGAQNAKAEVKDDQTVIFSATDVQPSANFTAIANFKRGTINFPAPLALRYSLQYLDWWWWVTLGLLLPLLSYAGLTAIKNKRGARALFEKTPEIGYSEPPAMLSPALVGILYHHRISAKEIAATLIDLAYRGYLQIIERAEEFTLGLRKPVADLSGFERALMDEFFADQTTITSSDIILKRQAAKALYSKRVTAIFENLYKESVAQGYFVEDPSRVRLKYFGIGILVFFTGILLFIPAQLFFSYIVFLPFTLLGVVLSGMVIVAFSKKLPTQRTPQGISQLEKWRGFAWWMKNYRPEGTQAIFQEVMMKNLPYALVMDIGEEWAKNFENLPFYLPKWYVTEMPLRSTVDFYKKILATAEQVAKTVDPSLR